MECVTTDLGIALRLPQREQGVLQLLAQQRVQSRKRLVHEQQIDVERERAREREALAHATRKAARVGLGEVLQADEPEGPLGALPALRLAHAVNLQAEFGVVADGLPRKQPEVLQDERRVLARRGDGRTVDGDRAARGLQQARCHLQRARLAAPGRPDDRDGLAFLHGKAQPVERERALSVFRRVAHRDVIEVQTLHGEAPPYAGT